MKIQIDIGHPAHVHYFRNFIEIMTKKGHSFFITSRDKEVTFDLLRKYNIPFISRGKGGKGVLGKVLYILVADIKLIWAGMRFKPDLFLSFASTYAAHASLFLRRPHIAFDDTEHSKFEIFLYRPFTNVILNPYCFKKDLGKKQIRFRGFMELCYLHPNHFRPDRKVLSMIGLNENEKFVLLRFVSWSAGHDFNVRGFSDDSKLGLVKALSEHVRVYISSEKKLTPELEPYKLPVPPEKLHDVLYYASLYIGEGATTASEGVMIGTPSIYVNPLSTGTLEEQERLGLLYSFRSTDGVLEKALQLLESPKEHKLSHQLMINDAIDMTAFIVWFIENYPKSLEVLRSDPGYQYRFR